MPEDAREYVKTGGLRRFYDLLEPCLLCKIFRGTVAVSIVAAVLLLPFLGPCTRLLGPFIWLHRLLSLITAGWFLLIGNRPPFEATDKMRREFLKEIKRKKLGMSNIAVLGADVSAYPPYPASILFLPFAPAKKPPIPAEAGIQLS